MPWRKSEPMDQRREFALKALVTDVLIALGRPANSDRRTANGERRTANGERHFHWRKKALQTEVEFITDSGSLFD
jgi:hypothetical protein